MLDQIQRVETSEEKGKSERDAVVLKFADQEFVLRRTGGNPFADPELDCLVGKRIRCDGTAHGQYFIMTNWAEVE